MSNEYEVIHARIADLDEIDKLARKHDNELGYLPRVVIREHLIRKEIICVRENSAIVGFCMFRFLRKGYSTIHDLLVVESARGKGIGKTLLKYLNKHTPLQLKVTFDNPANEFYRKIKGQLIKVEEGRKRKLHVYFFPPNSI